MIIFRNRTSWSCRQASLHKSQNWGSWLNNFLNPGGSTEVFVNGLQRWETIGLIKSAIADIWSLIGILGGFSDSSAGKKIHLQCRWPQFDSWVRKTPWRRDRLPTPVFIGFAGGSDGKESTCSAGHLDSIPGLGRSPGGGHGNPLKYSCLENPLGQRSLVGYSPWGCKESDATAWLCIAQHRRIARVRVLLFQAKWGKAKCSNIGKWVCQSFDVIAVVTQFFKKKSQLSFLNKPSLYKMISVGPKIIQNPPILLPLLIPPLFILRGL